MTGELPRAGGCVAPARWCCRTRRVTLGGEGTQPQGQPTPGPSGKKWGWAHRQIVHAEVVVSKFLRGYHGTAAKQLGTAKVAALAGHCSLGTTCIPLGDGPQWRWL